MKGFVNISTSVRRYYSHIKVAIVITAEEHMRITKPPLINDLLYKQSTVSPQSFKARPLKDLRFCSQFSAGQLLKCAVQKTTVLSPQVAFLRNSSLETITLPWSSDAHRHTKQMRHHSWETGRLQSGTSQVWLCGNVCLPLILELCKVSWWNPLRTERAGRFSWTVAGDWE